MAVMVGCKAGTTRAKDGINKVLMSLSTEGLGREEMFSTGTVKYLKTEMAGFTTGIDYF